MTGHETRWWWVRHAPVPDGGRIYGQRDLDCDCSDAAVFDALAHALPQNAVWVTSNLRRTHQTASAIRAAVGGRHAGDEPQQFAAFAEQHLGDWQGQEREAFYASRKALGHRFWFAAAHERSPGGESFDDLFARVAPVIDQVTAAHAGRDIVAVTHGGTIRAAVAHALGLPPQAALAFITDNCSITRLDHLGDAANTWRIGAVNHRPWSVRTGGSVLA